MQDTPKTIVARARTAFQEGITKNINHRIQTLKQFKKFFEENLEDIITAIYEDSKKHRQEARCEIYMVLSHVAYVIDNIKRWVKPEKAKRRFVELFDEAYVYSEPLGLVLVMSAWNVPLLTIAPVAGAIAGGNSVIIKPSHNSPSLGQLLQKILPKYIDSALYPVVYGNLEITSKLLDEKFDHIYCTGSTQVGKIVHQAASKHLTPTTLELGGKNPVYIDSTADLEIAAKRILYGKVFSSGQICLGPDYLLCSKTVEQKFLKYAKLTLQNFSCNNTTSCPVINKFHFDRLTGLMKGLNIVLGGQTEPSGNFIEPTIAVDVAPNHPIMQQEIFGPILPIVTVESMEDAVNFINERSKPLALYVFTKSEAVKEYFIQNTSSGAITINDTVMHLMVESLPFGGVGASGMGRFKANYSFDTFVNKKSVLDKNQWPILEMLNGLRYPPYSEKTTSFGLTLLKYRKEPSFEWLVYLIPFLLGLAVSYLL